MTDKALIARLGRIERQVAELLELVRPPNSAAPATEPSSAAEPEPNPWRDHYPSGGQPMASWGSVVTYECRDGTVRTARADGLIWSEDDGWTITRWRFADV